MFEKDHTPMIVHLDDYRINEYLDGYLHPSEASTVEAHLEVCPSCTVRLENLLVVFRHLETLPDISLDRDLSSDIIAQIQPDSSSCDSLAMGLVSTGSFCPDHNESCTVFIVKNLEANAD